MGAVVVSLNADLDVLARLGGELNDLGSKMVDYLIGDTAQGPKPDGMSSAIVAVDISHSLVDRSLIPAIQERLSETGDVMVGIAREYRDQDEQNVGALVNAYNTGLGSWTVEEPSV